MKGQHPLIWFRLGDGSVIKLPRPIARECRELGIPPEAIKKHYNRWNAPTFQIPSTYEQAAIRAIEERRLEIARGKTGPKRWS